MILNDQIFDLESDENLATVYLKIANGIASISSSGTGNSLVERPKKKRKLSKAADMKYLDLRFILPTSNICERLFFVAGFAMSSRRSSISPANFEKQMLLCANSCLWSIQDVNIIVITEE